MSCTYSIEHSPFGTVEVNERANALYISVKVSIQGTVRASVPRNTPTLLITNFLDTNRDRIVQFINKLKQKNMIKRVVFNPQTQFATRDHTLVMTLDENAKTERIKVAQGRILLTYCNDTDFENPDIQELIKRGINFALKVEAHKYLPPRLAELAGNANLKYNTLSIKNMKSRWGSCCKKRAIICLNTQLMRLPQHLIDFVIYHELAHLIEDNHGKHFHEIVNALCQGKERQFETELKKFTCDSY